MGSVSGPSDMESDLRAAAGLDMTVGTLLDWGAVPFLVASGAAILATALVCDVILATAASAACRLSSSVSSSSSCQPASG
eukprot:4710185-Pyramimonas_sp.AAC.1